MANYKSGINLECKLCNKVFYIIRSRISKSPLHFCSASCRSKFIVKNKKIYPKQIGICLYCKRPIVAKSAQFNKLIRKYCSYKCAISYRNTHIPKTDVQIEHARKLGLLGKGKKKPDAFRLNLAKALSGSKSRFWKGGLTNQNRLLRNSVQVSIWRTLVFRRDNYTCCTCNARNGNGKKIYLEAHHIKSWSQYPELRFDVNNGITLCKECHRMTDNYGFKASMVFYSLDCSNR